MLSKATFITACEEYNTFEKNVPAYCFRRSCVSHQGARARLTVAVCGLYQLYFNGEHITKGFLAPYISNTDHYVYCDEYELTLDEGENVIGLILGNGFQNDPGGHIWEFDRAPFRSAPKLALELECGGEILLDSGEGFKVCPSPIRSDDYRFGEVYDANYAIEGWCGKGFDDSSWQPALPAAAPKGELRVADIAPIVKHEEISPVDIFPCDGGYIYDFGVSNAGVCRLRIDGEKGQKVELQHADSLVDGELNIAQVWFVREHWKRDRHIVHKDTYVCSGDGTEEYQPSFTYHGFRYVKVSGITTRQATKDLLTFLVYHTRLNTRGDFTCSDGVATALQQMTRRSILSNFHHFPTDCPQREKNGWTADAALTSEAALLNFDPERNYREWMRNVCKAQREDGALPGIVPTGGWGFTWGNGPAWDQVLAALPYYTYIYRGQTEMIAECAPSFKAYLKYLRLRTDENGLLSIGLGDWCHVGGIDPKSPLILTDSVTAMDTASKIAEMLDVIGMHEDAQTARGEMSRYREAIRAHLIDHGNLCAAGECQTSQAMCLFYGVFEPCEEREAFDRLLDFIHAADDHIDLGVLGGRVIFHVLSRFGCSDLAFRMITRDDYPSYGNWLKRGATTLWEDFHPDGVSSMNHHFWGDVSAWFIKCIAGIRLNPDGHDLSRVEIKPAFIKALDHASAFHEAPAGRIAAAWRREGEGVILDVTVPEGMSALASADTGYVFEDGALNRELASGEHSLTCIRVNS